MGAGDRRRHQFAVGAPGSSARLDQFERLRIVYADSVERGLLEVTAYPPPRPKNCSTDAAWHDWFMAHLEGLDLTLSSQSQDYHSTSTAFLNAEERQFLYERHLNKYTESVAWWIGHPKEIFGPLSQRWSIDVLCPPSRWCT